MIINEFIGLEIAQKNLAKKHPKFNGRKPIIPFYYGEYSFLIFNGYN
jgi:hypothetical protein